MKKLTLLASMALVAVAANAQYPYVCDPVQSAVLDKGKVSYVGYVILDGAAVNAFTNQGAVVENYAPDEVTKHLYIWPSGESLVGVDATYLGVGDHTDGYANFEVASWAQQWYGAGYSCESINTSAWTDATRFHMAYYGGSNPIPEQSIVIADGSAMTPTGSKPAKLSIGAAVDGQPVIAPAYSDDWQGIDVSFADLKKIYPEFSPVASNAWSGNIFAFNGGDLAGKTFAFDAVYFYNLGESGVDGVEADASNWTVTAKTVNLNGANGIELYNLAGQLVKSTNGCVLGLNGLAQGVYVARSAKSAVKVVVK